MVRDQKSIATQNRSSRGRKYGRRILCLILALMFTLTGLPTGGVEEAKAARDISSFMLGEFISGKWDDATKTLTVNGTGTADELWAVSSNVGYNGDWVYIKNKVEKIVFGKGVAEVKRFYDMPHLQTIQFNNPNGVTLDEEAYTFRYLTALTKVILPPGVDDDVKNRMMGVINRNSGVDTVSHPISCEKLYTINIVSGTFDDGSNRKDITISQVSETKTWNITEVGPENVTFDKWVVKKAKDDVTELTDGVAWDNNSTAASKSAILKLTLGSNTPSTIYVAATFKKKETIDYPTALDQMWTQVCTYHQDQELDKAPGKEKVQASLKALLAGMSEMAGNIFSSFDVTVSGPAVTLASTQTTGSALYDVTLTATPSGISSTVTTSAVTTSGALSLTLKQKVNRSYTVIVEGGTINGVSASSKNYLLSEIEAGQEGSLPITFTSDSKKDKGLSYNGWTVEPNTVTLSAITATTGDIATGSAILTLTENSPSLIRVTANYKTSGQSRLDWDQLFTYLNGQILKDYKTEAERYIIDSATVPSAAAVQSALKERLDKEIARSDVLAEEGCSYTVTGPAIQDATTDADGKAAYEIALTLKKENDGESETEKYNSGLILKIPKKRSTTTGGGSTGGGSTSGGSTGGGSTGGGSTSGGSTSGGSTGGGSTGGGSTGGGGVPTTPTTPTTPEKPKDEEKPKDPEKPTDTEQPAEDPAEDPAPTSKPISTTTKTNTATVSVSDLQKAVDDETNAGMTIKYQNATLTFDAKAVESIVSQAKKIGSSKLKVVCKSDAQSSLNSAQKKALKNKTVIGCYKIYLKCGNKIISDFGTGKVKVKVPLKLKTGQKSKNVKLYYVDNKGKLTKQTASHSNGKLTYTTTHFSIYAAIYPKQTTTTDTDKTDTTDKTKKPAQETGKENETVPGGVVDDSMVGLPKAEENEEISYRTLQLHLSRSNDTSVCLGWNQVPGASGYELYGARCNTKTKKYEIIQITTLDAPTMNAWMCENLKKNTYYKFIVRAYMKKDGEKIYIARSRSAHVSTGGGGYGFIQDVIVDKPEVTLGVGKTSVIKATIDTAEEKIRSHCDLRFESSDSAVAKVSNSGKITAQKKGTCTIYVYTQNGLYTTVKVTVK